MSTEQSALLPGDVRPASLSSDVRPHAFWHEYVENCKTCSFEKILTSYASLGDLYDDIEATFTAVGILSCGYSPQFSTCINPVDFVDAESGLSDAERALRSEARMAWTIGSSGLIPMAGRRSNEAFGTQSLPSRSETNKSGLGPISEKASRASRNGIRSRGDVASARRSSCFAISDWTSRSDKAGILEPRQTPVRRIGQHASTDKAGILEPRQTPVRRIDQHSITDKAGILEPQHTPARRIHQLSSSESRKEPQHVKLHSGGQDVEKTRSNGVVSRARRWSCFSLPFDPTSRKDKPENLKRRASRFSWIHHSPRIKLQKQNENKNYDTKHASKFGTNDFFGPVVSTLYKQENRKTHSNVCVVKDGKIAQILLRQMSTCSEFDTSSCMDTQSDGSETNQSSPSDSVTDYKNFENRTVDGLTDPDSPIAASNARRDRLHRVRRVWGSMIGLKK